MTYIPLKDRFSRFMAKSESVENKVARLNIDKQLGIEAEKGIKTDFYLKILGSVLSSEREKAIKQIAQPNPESSRDRLSGKLELIESIMSNIEETIERGRKAVIELEEIRKKANG